MHFTAQVSKSQTVSQLNPGSGAFRLLKFYIILPSIAFYALDGNTTVLSQNQYRNSPQTPPGLRSRCRHPWRWSRRQMLPPLAMRMMNQADRPCQRWIRSFPDMSGETPKKWLWDGFSLQMGDTFTEMVDNKKKRTKKRVEDVGKASPIGINEHPQLV